MGDLISRQTAIDVLAAMQGQCTSKAALVQNSKIWQQIKDLPSAQPQQWIPVSERLPEEGQNCLVCVDGVIGIDVYLGHGGAYDWECRVSHYDAWMPLPEAWKGEEG